MQGMREPSRWWLTGVAPLALLLACLLGTAEHAAVAATDPGAGLAAEVDTLDNPVAEENNAEPAVPVGTQAQLAESDRYVSTTAALRRRSTPQPYLPHHARAPPAR